MAGPSGKDPLFVAPASKQGALAAKAVPAALKPVGKAPGAKRRPDPTPASLRTRTTTKTTLTGELKDLRGPYTNPKDPSKRYFGWTLAHWSYLPMDAADLQYTTTQPSAPGGKFVVTAVGSSHYWIRTGIEVKISAWTAPKSASQAQKDEWNRAAAGTLVHEDGHDAIFTKYATRYEVDVDGMTGEGASESAAFNALIKKVNDKMRADSVAQVAKAQAESDAYDVTTTHGTTQGAVLDQTVT